MNIAKTFNVPLVKGDFGFELEVEGHRLFNVVDYIDRDFWMIDDEEGSLRDGGLEFVSRVPSSKTTLLRQIAQLRKSFDDAGAVASFSPRTSCHVHMNVTNLELTDVLNLYILSLIAEPIVSKQCGTLREGNHFCLRAVDAEVILERAVKSLKAGKVQPFDMVRRYAFTNTASLARFGTIEYRGMEGTFVIAQLQQWLSTLLNLRKTAVKYDDTLTMLRDISEQGLMSFLSVRGIIPDNADIEDSRVDEAEELLEYFLAEAINIGERGNNPIEGLTLGEIEVMIIAGEADNNPFA